RDRPGRRRHRQRDLLQPGPRVLRGLAASRAGVGRRGGDRQAQGAHGDPDRRRSAGQEHRHRRDQLAGPAREDPLLPGDRPRGGSGDAPELLPGAGARLVVPADARHRRVAAEPDRAGGDLRPGACHPDLPHRGGGARQGQQHALRPVRRRLDRQGRQGLPHDPRHPRRGRLGQHLQQVRPDRAVRRLQGERHGPRGRPARARRLPGPRRVNRPARTPRVPVAKTYKLYIGGAFPRTESGRYIAHRDPAGAVIANVCRASRKDFRNAVVAARNAFGGWAGTSAYLRGQVLYRIAEMLEGRREQFAAELAKEGSSKRRAGEEGDASIDRIIHYAGWSDKYQQVFSTVNPVASPHFNFSVLEPTGVVAILAPEQPALLGFVSNVMPAIVGGNTVVVLASESRPL